MQTEIDFSKTRFQRAKFSDIYQTKEGRIGAGSFGEISICTKIQPQRDPQELLNIDTLNMPIDSQTFAVKRIKLPLPRQKNIEGYARAEGGILMYIRQELTPERRSGIIQCYECIEESDSLYIVIDLLTGGELFERVRMCPDIQIRDTTFYLAELVAAIGAMHSLGIVHRDLKPANLLLDENGHLKIIDFGMAKKIKIPSVMIGLVPYPGYQKEDHSINSEQSMDIQYHQKNKLSQPSSLKWGNNLQQDQQSTFEYPSLLSTFCGTAEYVSPEALGEKKYSFSVDWWALGCLAYELIVGQSPFFGLSIYDIYEHILQRQIYFPQNFPPDAKDFIDKLLDLNPQTRLGCSITQEDDNIKQIGSDQYVSNEWIQRKRKNKDNMNGRVSNWLEVMSHPFFKDIEWDKLSTQPPPISGVCDEKYDELGVHGLLSAREYLEEKERSQKMFIARYFDPSIAHSTPLEQYLRQNLNINQIRNNAIYQAQVQQLGQNQTQSLQSQSQIPSEVLRALIPRKEDLLIHAEMLRELYAPLRKLPFRCNNVNLIPFSRIWETKRQKSYLNQAIRFLQKNTQLQLEKKKHNRYMRKMKLINRAREKKKFEEKIQQKQMKKSKSSQSNLYSMNQDNNQLLLEKDQEKELDPNEDDDDYNVQEDIIESIRIAVGNLLKKQMMTTEIDNFKSNEL
ncbi:MAG: putative protein kinase [Streblomastix strix]|uniref:non-specific serine/threonine protein kinase n=1 Tax=Streblomastix strix TaxID=222440 RepID=A0A5J4VCM7_9EUKA|nr:MAG: putative protein kinase [Streblomastix strix]